MRIHVLIASLSVVVLAAACGSVDKAADAGQIPDGGDSVDGGGGTADAMPDATPDADPSNPILSVDPASHEFGPVPVGSTSSSVTFTISNTGGAAATGCAVPAMSGANAGDFAIAVDNCGTSDLVAGGSCTVQVSVSPAATGLRTATLSRSCADGGAVSTDADGLAVNRPMYIFISSQSYTGALGGLSGADTICNNLAAAGSLTSSMNKDWKALLSKDTGGVVNARDRVVWTGPLMDLRGNVVTADPSSWPWSPASGVSINVNENAGGPDDSYSWSGSTAAGLSKGAALDCNGWTDGTGTFDGQAGETASFPSASWFDSFSNDCGSQWFGIYCVSQEP